jgi:hypothetical protein
LEQAIRTLNNTLAEEDRSLEWLRQRSLGRAYNTIGYLLRTYGHYQDAAHYYQLALPYFQASGSEDEQADTLNNLAFLLATVGERKLKRR